MKLSTIFRRAGRMIEEYETINGCVPETSISTAIVCLRLTQADYLKVSAYLNALEFYNASKSWTCKAMLMYFAAHMARSEGL